MLPKILILAALPAIAFAQANGKDQLARGQAAWSQRLSESAILAFEAATRDPAVAAEAHEALGRI